jgi:hypothetical protein
MLTKLNYFLKICSSCPPCLCVVFVEIIAFFVFFFAVASLRAAEIEQLEYSFAQPPDDARIMVRWWWFGPAVTKPQLEREMKFMKEGGIGGFEVQATYPLALDDEVPGLKNLRFLSPEHLDALHFTAEKAKELGLRMDLTLGSGWPYGGSIFPIEEAAGALRTSTVQVPAGQRSVPVRAPQGRPGENTVIAAFAAAAPGGQTNFKAMKEVEIRDNAAQLPEGINGPATVVFFFAGHTGMQVKRPAFGAEGNVLDHYDPAAIDKFLKQIAEPAVKACEPNAPYAVFCDSLEVNGEDWTGNLLEEFQKRRGYNLRPYLPALVGDIGEKTLDIRHDWGKTITEVFTERFVATIQQWSKQHGSRLRIQGYGTPPSALFSYASSALPEGEGYAWKGFCTSRWAASAAHLMGQPVASSETWTWLHSPVFRATPLDMKAEADLHFLQGINQLIGHGWPYTAEGIEYPGWRFYASAVFDEKNPWWIVMPDVTKYLQRVSYILRQGTPANDVALYLANSDAWSQFQPGSVSLSDGVNRRLGNAVIGRILDAGFNFDFFDDGMLDLRGRVEGGALAFGDVRYKVIVLAGVERIPAATMKKLEEFARGGGTVIATRRIPALAPGLKATEEEQKTVRDIAERLFSGPNALGIYIQNEEQLAEALAKRLRADVVFSPSAPEIGAVHRRTGSSEVYFLANTSNQRRSVRASFRVEGMLPECWDPMTGRSAAMEIAEQSAGATSVAVNLEPYESTIVVFTKRDAPKRSIVKGDASPPPAIDLSNGWSVKFGVDAKPVAMENLSSWTDDEATRFFSGVAVYEKSASVPPEMLKEGVSVHIDFGQPRAQASGGRRGGGGDSSRMQAVLEAPVREAAVVYVNDKRAGSVWHPPYSVDITGLLRAGENRIRIEVANLAVNYMAGRPLPNYQALIQRYGNRFQPQDMNGIQALPSGLLGPIQITTGGRQ